MFFFFFCLLGIFPCNPCMLLPSRRLLLRSFFAYTCLRESWRRTALGLDALLLGASVEIVRELCEWASAEICRHYTNWSGFGASFVRSSSAVWRVCWRRCLTRMLWLFVMNCWIPALRRGRLSGFICLFDCFCLFLPFLVFLSSSFVCFHSFRLFSSLVFVSFLFPFWVLGECWVLYMDFGAPVHISLAEIRTWSVVVLQQTSRNSN